MIDMLVKMSPEEKKFLDDVRQAMQRYFGEDRRRIAHAEQVCRYAEELLAYVDADAVITLAAACLHDIGIHEAELRHGSSSGHWQEVEGPPIAKQLLEELSAEPSLVDAVTTLVGRHHTPGGVDSPEFRILWDADALVNFAEVLPDKPADQVEAILDKHMVTEAGYRRARQLYGQASSQRREL